MNSILNILLGLIFIIGGLVSIKIKKDNILGIRTIWALKHDDLWKANNKFGGFALIIMGSLIMIFSLIFNALISTIIMAIIILIYLLVTMIYSFGIHYKKFS